MEENGEKFQVAEHGELGRPAVPEGDGPELLLLPEGEHVHEAPGPKTPCFASCGLPNYWLTGEWATS